MMILRYVGSILLLGLVVAFVFLTAPLWAFVSAALGLKTLPGFLANLHTFNDDLDGGQHQLGWTKKAAGVELWWQRTRWMWRNPAGGTASALGVGPENIRVLRDSGDPDSENFLRRVTYENTVTGRRYFFWQLSTRWLGPLRIKFWMGWDWKLKGGRHPIRFDFNPFRTTS